MTPEDVAKHREKQNDLKQFIQVLSPLAGVHVEVDKDVQKLACDKLKELIPLIQIEIKESLIKTLQHV